MCETFVVNNSTKEIVPIKKALENIDNRTTKSESVMATEALMAMGETGIDLMVTSKIIFYQTEDALETVAIIEDPDGSVSIGIARAGRIDIEAKRITRKEGMKIAEGRAKKVRKLKESLIEKNYLRGIYAKKIEV